MYKKIRIIYDWECFFCKRFGAYAELKKKYGVDVIPAQKIWDELKILQEQWYDIDEWMLVQIDDQWFHWPEAITQLNKCLEGRDLLSRLFLWVSKKSRIRVWLYPMLRFLRRRQHVLKWRWRYSVWK